MAKATKAVTQPSDQMPAFLKGKESVRGSENVGTDDIQIPRISILQALSPQVDESAPEYIAGAKQGQIFNVLTQEIYPDGVQFIPVFFEKDHLVWKKRDAGGGLIGRCESAQAANALADTDPSYEYIDAPNHISLLLDDDGGVIGEVSIPMAQSKAKVSRRLNSLIRLNGGDRFSRVYKLLPIPDESPRGKYWNFATENVGWVNEPQFQEAEELYTAITSGQRRYSTDYSDAEEGSGQSAGEEF